MSGHRPGHELHLCLLLLIRSGIRLLLVLQAVLWIWVSWRNKAKKYIKKKHLGLPSTLEAIELLDNKSLFSNGA